jgi:hypothetical protein
LGAVVVAVFAATAVGLAEAAATAAAFGDAAFDIGERGNLTTQ